MNDSYSDDDRIANADPGPPRPFLDPKDSLAWEMRDALQRIVALRASMSDAAFRSTALALARTTLRKWEKW